MAGPNDPLSQLLTRNDINKIAGEQGVGRRTLALETMQQQALVTNPSDIAAVKLIAQAALAEANTAAGSAAHALVVANQAEADAAAALAEAANALALAQTIASTMTATATDALTAGMIVHTYFSTDAKVQKANATDLTKPANGFVVVDVASGDVATVHRLGENSNLSGLNPGDPYWLSTTGGAVSATAPSVSGNGSQIVGYADTSGALYFNPQTMFGV
jgi:hypothetical protein